MDARVKQITHHIESHIGRIHTVFHEVVSDDLHIDLHHVKSTLFRRYEVLVTSGMSTRPMAVPAQSSEPRFAEVLAILPKGWPLAMEDFRDERNYWPLRLLKTLARYPHHANTWLGFGHTLANGESDQETRPYADGTDLCAALLVPSASLGPAAWSFKRPDGEEVFFWSVLPLHRSELLFKHQHGVDPLLTLFDRCGVSDRIDPTRPAVTT